LVLAITDHPTTLHQFFSSRKGTLETTFSEYQQNPSLLKEHTIRIDAASGESQIRREDNEGDQISYNQLRLFQSAPKNEGDDGAVGGFGWMNEFGFYYASYNTSDNS
jgi:hypothetical protein